MLDSVETIIYTTVLMHHRRGYLMPCNQVEKMEIHRHCNTSETCIVIRGSVKYTLFTNDGGILETFVLKANSECFGYNVPAGQWHTLEPLETEPIIFGCKDGPYHPLSQQDILKVTKFK